MSAPAISPPEAPAPRRAAFAFVFVTVLLDMLALGMIIPVFPRLVADFVGGDTAYAAQIFGLFGTGWSLMQFLAGPVQGALSDRFGRRPIILASNIGLGLDYVMMALAPSLPWLFVGRLVSGITAASISTGFAYIADVTPPEKRAARFGMMGAAFGLGFVLGPAVGGLAGASDPRLPFWIAAGLSLLNALYGAFVLPESLPKERRAPFTWRNANPLGSLKLLRSQPQLLGLAAVNFLNVLAHAVLPSTAVLYMGYRYGWGADMIGLTLAGVGVFAMIAQGLLVGMSVRRFGERATVIAGLLFGVAGFTIYGFAPVGAIFLVGVPLMAMDGMATAATPALMSRMVSSTEQGRLQGANASLQGIANLIGPGLFTQVFAFSIAGGGGHVPGAAMLLAALLLAAAALLCWRMTRAKISSAG